MAHALRELHCSGDDGHKGGRAGPLPRRKHSIQRGGSAPFDLGPDLMVEGVVRTGWGGGHSWPRGQRGPKPGGMRHCDMFGNWRVT